MTSGNKYKTIFNFIALHLTKYIMIVIVPSMKSWWVFEGQLIVNHHIYSELTLIESEYIFLTFSNNIYIYIYINWLFFLWKLKVDIIFYIFILLFHQLKNRKRHCCFLLYYSWLIYKYFNGIKGLSQWMSNPSILVYHFVLEGWWRDQNEFWIVCCPGNHVDD